MKVLLIPLLWLLLIASPAISADNATLPKPSKYVTDNAGVLKDGGAALNEQLKSLESTTTAQLLVYIDKKLPANTTIEDVAVASFRSWGVGQKDKNNGVALFVFIDDRKMRLEVGYGLEGRIPDLVAKRILDTKLKPAFKQQRYGEGINAAVNELTHLVKAETTTNGKAAVSKEGQHTPFGGSASSLQSSSSSASTEPSSNSSSSNSSGSSSAASSASPR
ncbi:MAG: TPM domain-containing protein, partial [Nitrosomonadaceae bacterium]|nr:TPM domain-containing protein [Nitrosomonadaceae bacterium]